MHFVRSDGLEGWGW